VIIPVKPVVAVAAQTVFPAHRLLSCSTVSAQQTVVPDTMLTLLITNANPALTLAPHVALQMFVLPVKAPLLSFMTAHVFPPVLTALSVLQRTVRSLAMTALVLVLPVPEPQTPV